MFTSTVLFTLGLYSTDDKAYYDLTVFVEAIFDVNKKI